MPGNNCVVFVVEPDEVQRHRIEELGASVQLKVVTFQSAETFLASYEAAQAGCLVVEMRMSPVGGLELQRELMRRRHDIPVVMISQHADVTAVAQAMRMGAIDFLSKPFSEQIFLDRVQEALRLDCQRRAHAAEREFAHERLTQLTEREREVFDLLMSGLGNKQIAYELGLSVKAIEARRARIRGKLQTDSMVDMVSMALLLRDDTRPYRAIRNTTPTESAEALHV